MQVMTGEYAGLQVLGPEEGRDDPALNEMIARRLLAAHPDLAGIYNIGYGPEGIAAALMDDARRRRPLFISHESTPARSEEHTSELQSLMRISYADFCLKKKNQNKK